MCENTQSDKACAVLADLIKSGDASLVLSNSGEGFVLETDRIVEDVISPPVKPDPSTLIIDEPMHR